MSRWMMTPLKGHIAEVSSRKGDAQVDVLSVSNVYGFVRSLDAFDKQVYSQDTRNYKLVSFDDLAYNPSRINVGSIARCQIPEGGAVSPMYTVVRCRKSLLPQYLLSVLKSDVGRQQINRRCVGAVRFQLRFGDLEQIEIPLPPLGEQHRIIEILSEAEELRQARSQADVLTETYCKELFLEFFGDPITNPKKWPSSTVGSRLAYMEYGPRFYNESYSTDGTRIVRITDLDSAGRLNFDSMPKQRVEAATLERRMLRPGDLIFARSGATAGKVALVPTCAPTCIAGAYFIRMRFDDTIDPVFGFSLLRSRGIQDLVKRQSAQAAQPNFSGPKIRSLPLPLPPIELQKNFSSYVAEVDDLRSQQIACSRRIDDLFQALQHFVAMGDL